jgi:uncharacterized protein (TIGR00369 family)
VLIFASYKLLIPYLYDKVQSNFARQGLMKTLNASLDKVEPGIVEISSTFDESLSQQHGYFHAGVMASIADSACGYAALTAAPEGKDVLSVEFKINLMKPANTNKIVATARVIQAGKTLTICEATVHDASGQKLIAKMTATMMIVDIHE